MIPQLPVGRKSAIRSIMEHAENYKNGNPLWRSQGASDEKSEYDEFDYIIGMDRENRRNMMRILGADPENKVQLLLDFTDSPRSIADPWYTGNFDITYDDVKEGCEALLQYITEHDMISER